MSDDVEALIAEARRLIADCATYNFGMRNADKLAHEVAGRLADALEAAQQAPAVDREALVKAFLGNGRAVWFDPEDAREMASDVIASGVLLDAAEVEARGLETVATIIENPRPGKGDTLNRADVVAALRNRADQRRSGLPLDPELRAQQVREGN